MLNSLHLDAAVNYVLNNNPYAKNGNWTEEYVRGAINGLINTLKIDDTLTSCSTMGVTVTIDDVIDLDNDQSYIVVSITVIPSYAETASDSDYVFV